MENSNKILYHITPKNNWENNIKDIGLIPNYPWKRKGLTTYCCSLERIRQESIYLTNDPQWILQNHGGWRWYINNKPLLLEININGLKINQETEYYQDKEFRYKGKISLKRIKSIKNIDWSK